MKQYTKCIYVHPKCNKIIEELTHIINISENESRKSEQDTESIRNGARINEQIRTRHKR